MRWHYLYSNYQIQHGITDLAKVLVQYRWGTSRGAVLWAGHPLRMSGTRSWRKLPIELSRRGRLIQRRAGHDNSVWPARLMVVSSATLAEYGCSWLALR